MLAQVVYIAYTPLGKKWCLCTRRLAYYITWIMVTWCILCIYDPKTSAFRCLQYICPSPLAWGICTANVLWPQFGSNIRGIHHVTMIYILHVCHAQLAMGCPSSNCSLGGMGDECWTEYVFPSCSQLRCAFERCQPTIYYSVTRSQHSITLWAVNTLSYWHNSL